MMKREELLDKYYKGETSPEEEKELKALFADDKIDSAEKDMFGYFQKESFVPNDLETTIYSGLTEKVDKRRKLKIRFFSISSAAAAVIIFISIYLNFQIEKNTKMENNFLVMEKALFQVSESIQPEEQKEMLVLWVDDDVEIIIN
jgi:hypothetical protein